jgi:hypothetical protein
MALLPEVPCGPMTEHEHQLARAASAGDQFFRLEELHVVAEPGVRFIVTFFSERAGKHVLVGAGSNYRGLTWVSLEWLR